MNMILSILQFQTNEKKNLNYWRMWFYWYKSLYLFKKKTLFGLPQKVIFCKKTLMSNQRPTSSIEFHHNSKSKKKTLWNTISP